MEIREKMSVTRTQTYKKIIQLALRVEPKVKDYLEVTSRRENDLVLYPISHQRKVKVLNHLIILLVLGLVQSVLHSPSDHYNCLSWVHHHLVLLLKVER